MFDIGWGEFLLIGVVALIAIGPKELPGVLRAVGQWVTKIRRMAGDFQNQFQEAMREAELGDIQKQVKDIIKPAPFNDGYDEYANPKPGVPDPYKAADDVTPGDAPWDPNPETSADSGSLPEAGPSDADIREAFDTPHILSPDIGPQPAPAADGAAETAATADVKPPHERQA